jgi:hypothetical protein
MDENVKEILSTYWKHDESRNATGGKKMQDAAEDGNYSTLDRSGWPI